MYDKRYSNQQIKRIRQGSSASMFFVMLLLCVGVGKVAYWMGHQNGYIEGYNGRMNDDVVNPVSSFVPASPKAMAARLDITPIPEPGFNSQQINHPGCWKCQLRNSVNWILKYWFVGCIAQQPHFPVTGLCEYQ